VSDKAAWPAKGKAHKLEHLWWVMHHSDDPDRQALAVTCYLDESATDGSTTEAVVAGLQMNRSNFLHFDDKWDDLLERYHLRPALHMKDFGRHGRFSDMCECDIRSILEDACDLINVHKIYSLAVTLEHAEYQRIFHDRIKNHMSVYGLCFIATAYANHLLATQNHYKENIAVVLDSGNPYASHVLLAHGELKKAHQAQSLNLGSLTFESDEIVTPLQAADVIAWGVRRKATGYSFKGGFESIERLLARADHAQAPYPVIAMQQLMQAVENDLRP